MSSGFLGNLGPLILLLIVIAIAPLVSINNIIYAAAQTIDPNLQDECIRLGISPENCSEEQVLKNRPSHPPGTEIVDNQSKIMNWWLVIIIIAVIFSGGASILLIRSNSLRREVR
jgi:hypothetical protein